MSRCEICDVSDNPDCESLSRVPMKGDLTDDKKRASIRYTLGKFSRAGGSFLCKDCRIEIAEMHVEYYLADEVVGDIAWNAELIDTEEPIDEIPEDASTVSLWEIE